MIKILFVCMGNICRSPTAHGVMQHKIHAAELGNRFEIDSAGTHAYHIGEKSDPRSRAKGMSMGIDMEYIRARKISVNDHDEFDYILAMDDENLELINYYAPEHSRAKVSLFLDFAVQQGLCEQNNVPDPYYGGAKGFDTVFELVDIGCEALIKHCLQP